MDADLEELIKGFSGYGVESWMKASYLAMAKQVQELRDVLRGRNVTNNKSLDPKPLDPAPGTKWRHFKGTVYTVVRVSRDCEDPTRFLVTYEDASGESWIREHSNFMGTHENGQKRFIRL
jgi:hypothetical protein